MLIAHLEGDASAEQKTRVLTQVLLFSFTGDHRWDCL